MAKHSRPFNWGGFTLIFTVFFASLIEIANHYANHTSWHSGCQGDFLTEPFWCGQFVHCSKHPSLRKAKGCGLLRSLTDILFMMYSVRPAHAQNMPFEKVPLCSGRKGI